jgi:sulfur-carrier protein adenylyltransferase/sulfurtransferase
LVAIGRCNLIIDATAEPQVFNLCAAVARNEEKPFVWGEVFAGGIGGLIARLRPNHEPVPHAARRQIDQWCGDRGIDPPHASAVQYGLNLPDAATPMIADDADVSVIAGHIAKMALDVLAREESQFPQPAYAVGLRAGWIFEAPFDTWPIDLSPEGVWGPEKDDNLSEELGALAMELFPAAKSAGEAE